MNMRKILLGIFLLMVALCAGCAKAETDTGVSQKPDYSISLETAQVETFQSATSHLLRRVDKNRYYVQYRDCGAVLEDGKLATLYDGMGVAISEKTKTVFPVLNLHGGQGNLLQCTGKVMLTLDEESTGWRSLLQVDRDAQTATLVGVSVLTESTDEELLSGKYSPTPDVSQYRDMSCFFSDSPVYRMAYDQNGKPLPTEKLETDDNYLHGYSCEADGDLELRYIPLQGDGYYLVYEITDTNGQVYCSDLIPYAAEEIPQKEDLRDAAYLVKWEKGAREQFLFSQNGLDLYLAVTKGAFDRGNIYAIKARNNTDNTVYVYAADVIINDKIYSDQTGDVEVAPGKFVAGEIGYSIAASAPEVEQIASLLFSVEASEGYHSGQTVIEKTFVQVDMTDAWWVDREFADSFLISHPAMDALAEEQQLLENENLRVTLVNAGAAGNDNTTLRLVFKAENLSPYTQDIAIDSIEVNGIHMGQSRKETIPGHCITYMYVDIWDSEMAFMETPSVQTLQVVLRLPPEESWNDPVKVYCPLNLAQSGTAGDLKQAELLWETEGAQVRLLRYDGEKNKWWLSFRNTSDQNLKLKAQEVSTGADALWMGTVEPGETAVASVDNPNGGLLVTGDTPYTIRMQLYETDYGELYAELTEPVTLHTD